MSTRGAVYCSFINCSSNTNTSSDPRTNSRLKFHSYPNPEKEKERCLKWIVNSRREDLSLKNVKRKRVCSLHFEPLDYNCPESIEDSRLLPGAVPTIVNCPNPPKPIRSKRKPPKQRDLSQPKKPQDDDTSERNPVDQFYDGDDDVPNILLGSTACSPRNTMDTVEDSGQVLKMHLSPMEREVKMLVEEYRFLYETFQCLKGLARIDVDLLYLSADLSRVPKSKEEVDKVQGLVHILMNGREIYRIEISNLKEELSTGDDADLDLEYSLAGEEEDTIQGLENECDISHNLDVKSDYEATETDLTESDKLACTLEEQKVASTSRELMEQPLNNGSSKMIVDLGFGKAALADNTLPVFDSPEFSSSGNSTRDESYYGKTLKNRIELRQYVNSPESYDISGKRICKFCNCLFVSEFPLQNHLVEHLESKLYICKQCGFEVEDLKDYIKHVLSHKEVDEKRCHKCLECGREFSHESVRNQHVKLAHSSIGMSKLCHTSGATFKKNQSLVNHLEHHKKLEKKGPRVCEECAIKNELSLTNDLNVPRKKKTRKKNMCDICGKRIIIKRPSPQRHKNPELEGPAPCPICGKTISKPNLKRHIREHSGEKPFQCAFCHKAFPQSSHRDAHQRLHTGLHSHRCSYCTKGFTSAGSLHIHEKIHSEERVYSCLDCGKLFMPEASAKAHTEEFGQSHKCVLVSSTKDKKYSKYKNCKHQCSHCDKLFRDNISFASHMFTSYNRELDMCLLCNDDVTFASSLDLESHMKTVHFNENPFECGTCGESFHMFRDYYAHKSLHLHTDKKAYICEDCGKSYSFRVSLRNHRILKHSVKPLKIYSCDVCGKQFTTKQNHRRHQLLHSGLKPYKCSVCKATFTTDGILKMHLWTHSNAKKYQCGKCDRGFNDKRNLVSHTKKSHPEIV